MCLKSNIYSFTFNNTSINHTEFTEPCIFQIFVFLYHFNIRTESIVYFKHKSKQSTIWVDKSIMIVIMIIIIVIINTPSSKFQNWKTSYSIWWLIETYNMLTENFIYYKTCKKHKIMSHRVMINCVIVSTLFLLYVQ